MTGRDTFLTGMQYEELDNAMPWGLPLDEVTLAERFKSAGYATHMVSTVKKHTLHDLQGNPCPLSLVLGLKPRGRDCFSPSSLLFHFYCNIPMAGFKVGFFAANPRCVSDSTSRF